MDKPKTLQTTEDVIEALGGLGEAATLTGRKRSAAWMWLRAKTFPANTYVVMTEALKQRGKTAPASLWGMTDPGADNDRQHESAA